VYKSNALYEDFENQISENDLDLIKENIDYKHLGDIGLESYIKVALSFS